MPEARPCVLRYADCDQAALVALLRHVGLTVTEVADQQPIPGSFWGDEEAGLIGAAVFVRGDTPVHSVLHESCHFVCMDEARRAALHTNAGGTLAEENAVCYLQILLADLLPDMSQARMCRDMDAWGYTFRLGSARRWFDDDAEDARQWLQRRELLELPEQLAHFNRIPAA